MKSYLKEYYDLLSTSQKSGLKDFFNSPYFNKDKKHCLLYQVFISEEFYFLEREKVYEMVFESDSFKESMMKKILVEHGRLLRKFFIVNHIVYDKLGLLQSLRFSNINTSGFLKEMERKHELSKEVVLNNDWYDYQLNELKLTYLIEEPKITLDEIRITFKQKVLHYNDFNLINQLKLLSEYYNLEGNLNLDFDIPWHHRLDELITEAHLSDKIEAQIHAYILVIRKGGDYKESFTKLLILVKSQKFLNLPYHTQLYLFKNVVGICILIIVRRNETSYTPHLFNLHLLGLEHHYFKGVEGYIGQRSYKNIVRSAINNNEIEWAIEFVKNSADVLNPNEKEDAINFNLGALYFAQKDYELSLRYLSQVPYDNLYYSTHLRLYLIRIYYETDDVEPFLAMISSFRAYLKRNRILSPQAISSFRNFLNSIKRLYLLNKYEKKRIQDLKKKVEATNPVVEKKWLIEKIREKL